MADVKISALPAGSLAASGDVPMVQTGVTVKVTLGIMAYQAASAVAITGGSITGITDLAVADGGTGRSSATAYAVICGGTTGTGAQQSVAAVGSFGDVLTSNGAGALPTFQAPAGGSIGGSTGATDNRILRANGTGGATLQNSLVTITDIGDILPAGAGQFLGDVAAVSAGESWGGMLIADNGGIQNAAGAGLIFTSAPSIAFVAAAVPFTNDFTSLGISGTAWSDLFLASGSVVNWDAGDVTLTHGANLLTFSGATNGYAFATGPVKPSTNDGAALGTATLSWSDLFLASGAVMNFANGNVTITHATGVLTIGGGGLVLAAGTTTRSPLTFTSGTNLTTAAAGVMEYDGRVHYATSVASSRQVLNAEQFSMLTADRTGTDVNTAQAVFGASEDTLTLAASTTYEFEAEYQIDSTGTTNRQIGILFAGTATFTSIAYSAIATNGAAAATPSAPAMSRFAVATVSNVTAATIATATQNTIRLRGVMRINGAGTVIPQFQYSAAPGVAPSVRANSFFRIWPVGINTVAAVGFWN